MDASPMKLMIHEKSMKNLWKIYGKSMENRWKIYGKSMENGDLMGFHGIYPLVNVQITMENHHV